MIIIVFNMVVAEEDMIMVVIMNHIMKAVDMVSL
jgi:hypothetical protein